MKTKIVPRETKSKTVKTKPAFVDGLTLSHAKRNFEFGFLTGYRIEKMFGFWSVSFIQQGYSGPLYLLDARLHQAREFKSLDGAVSAVESVGFQVDQLGSK